MIRYEVTLDVDPAGSAEVTQYMRDVHIPEIFATGCFHTIRLERGSPTRLRTTDLAFRADDLDHYLRAHAPALRSAFQARFPAGVRVVRETWTEIAVWE
jgi:hypothetical protein